MSVETFSLGKDTNYPTTYQPDILFLSPVLQHVSTMRMLKVFNKVKTGGMFLKFLG